MRKRRRFQMCNGYVLRYVPNHPHAMRANGYKGYVYEHELVAERLLKRRLRKGEEVHHLDLWRSNNSPENIVVLSVRAHQRIHAWIARGLPLYGNSLIDSVSKNTRRAQIPRCKMCSHPTKAGQMFCSRACVRAYHANYGRGGSRKCKRPDREKLLRLLSKHSWLAIGKHYGVSDNAVRKWARAMGIDPKQFARGKIRRLA